MQNFKRLGEFIKFIREERGFSQEDLANKLNVSKSTISLYESGERKPSLKRLSQIAEVLQTPLSKLLELEPAEVDIDLALRAEGLSNDDIKRIKSYIKLVKEVKDANKTKQKKSQK